MREGQYEIGEEILIVPVNGVFTEDVPEPLRLRVYAEIRKGCMVLGRGVELFRLDSIGFAELESIEKFRSARRYFPGDFKIQRLNTG